MAKRRVLAIGLDGYEASVADALILAGKMPAMARLQQRGARFLLDHGLAKHTGLAWEHVSTGLSPDAARRWSAVVFDPESYAVWQQGTTLKPFTASLSARSVVFDSPYYDLLADPDVSGLVNWGAHDPGTINRSRPASLAGEIEARFGPYPAQRELYGYTWPSAADCTSLGQALSAATTLRGKVARWLLEERLPDWDFALVVIGEPHSATEALWHGVDAGHPLHGLPSTGAARNGLHAVYEALDRAVGDLESSFPDATIVAFAMHGMGANTSDPGSMVLLPELLYRHAFGRPLLRAAAVDAATGYPVPAPGADWNRTVARLYPSRLPESLTYNVRRARRRMKRMLEQRRDVEGPERLALDWMPATQYQRSWPKMPAFALPSYYDGRIRVNLAGRERDGIVQPEQYDAVCDEIEALLHECRDPRTAEPVVELVTRPAGRDIMRLGATDADLSVIWRGTAAAIEHPRLGVVGPVPFRRPGGHTGAHGVAYIAGDGLEAGERGTHSAFDVVPTIVELLGEPPLEGLTGSSLLLMTPGNTLAQR